MSNEQPYYLSSRAKASTFDKPIINFRGIFVNVQTKEDVDRKLG